MVFLKRFIIETLDLEMVFKDEESGCRIDDQDLIHTPLAGVKGIVWSRDSLVKGLSGLGIVWSRDSLV